MTYNLCNVKIIISSLGCVVYVNTLSLSNVFQSESNMNMKTKMQTLWSIRVWLKCGSAD